MKNLTLIATLFFLIGIVACKKNLNESPLPSNNVAKATKVEELKASPNFKWNTNKTVTIQVAGLKTITPVNRTLKITSLDGKTIYFQANQTMDVSNSHTFSIPTKITEVMVSYGKITKILNTTGTSINFNYFN